MTNEERALARLIYEAKNIEDDPIEYGLPDAELVRDMMTAHDIARRGLRAEAVLKKIGASLQATHEAWKEGKIGHYDIEYIENSLKDWREGKGDD